MSKTMTKSQVAHLSARINEEINNAVAKFAEGLPKSDVMEVTFEQKVDLIRNGAAVLKATNKLSTYTDLDDAYTYPTLDKIIAANKKQKDKNEAAVAKFKAPLLAKKQIIMDSAILGGADEAMQALQNFIKQLNK